jgi:8-oxo-dGTP pyrophosphatase MutT (NUDIX family)
LADTDSRPIIRIVAVVFVDEQGRVLMVRKRGTTAFMHPGGKVVSDETAVDPMLAKAADKVPDDPGVWSYEPKWDGLLR